MKYTCTECGYVYDEAKGEPNDDIAPWTKMEDLWEYFTCPGCYTDASSFIAAKEEISYPMDIHNLNSLEKEHLIRYEIENNELNVRIGEPEHVMGEDHYISSISLLDERGEVIEEKFLAPDDAPEVMFDLDYLDTFEIVCRCTQHWLWGSGKIFHWD